MRQPDVNTRTDVVFPGELCDATLQAVGIRVIPVQRLAEAVVTIEIPLPEESGLCELINERSRQAELCEIESKVIRCMPALSVSGRIGAQVHHQSGTKCSNHIEEQRMIAAGEETAVLAGSDDSVVIAEL